MGKRASDALSRLWALVLPTLVCLEPWAMAFYLSSADEVSPGPERPAITPPPPALRLLQREQLLATGRAAGAK
jgi:hypothetical protein